MDKLFKELQAVSRVEENTGVLRFKIKGITDQKSVQDHIEGIDENGWVIRNIGKGTASSIIRQFVFGLAEELKKAGKGDFKVTGINANVIGQTPLFYRLLMDNRSQYIEEMLDESASA
jgi:hypothetical protein